MKCCVCFLLAALLCGGCGGPGGLPEPADDPSELESYTALDKALALPPLLDELEPCPELDEAIRQSEAVGQGESGPAAPIPEAKYRRWTRLAELCLDLELARVRARCLRHVVEQLRQCEQQYLDRVGNGALYRGENAARQLAIFRRLRHRFDGDLAVAKRRAGDLGERLARLEREEPGGGWLAAEGGPPDALAGEADPGRRIRSAVLPPEAVEEDDS